jgi:hypothetical protein
LSTRIVIAASAEMEGKTPAVDMADAKKAVVAQIEKFKQCLVSHKV